MSLLAHLRRIKGVDDESGLPPIADELLRHGERRKGQTTTFCTAEKQRAFLPPDHRELGRGTQF